MKIFFKITLFLLIPISILANAQEIKHGRPDTTNKTFSQFSYLIGSWSIDMKMRNKTGEFVLLPNKGQLKGFYHQDGRTVQTIFTTPKGFFSTDIRAYDLKSNKWRAHFLNAKSQRWHNFESKLEDGKMITMVKGGFSGKEPYDVRIIHHNFSQNSFSGEIFHSADGGKNWHQVYQMEFSRLH